MDANCPFILPIEHVVGERYRRQCSHNIIAMSSDIGHINLVITKTHNPNWPETRRILLLKQVAQNRADPAVKEFMMKLGAFTHLID